VVQDESRRGEKRNTVLRCAGGSNEPVQGEECNRVLRSCERFRGILARRRMYQHPSDLRQVQWNPSKEKDVSAPFGLATGSVESEQREECNRVLRSCERFRGTSKTRRTQQRSSNFRASKKKIIPGSSPSASSTPSRRRAAWYTPSRQGRAGGVQTAPGPG